MIFLDVTDIPDTIENVFIGDTLWTSLANAKTTGIAYASNIFIPDDIGKTWGLGGKNYLGFIVIPVTASILGIEVTIKCSALSYSSFDIQLYQGGLEQGNIKSYITPLSPTLLTFGGSTDLWGISATLLLAWVTDPTFGYHCHFDSDIPNTFQANSYSMKIYYAVPNPDIPTIGEAYMIGQNFRHIQLRR